MHVDASDIIRAGILFLAEASAKKVVQGTPPDSNEWIAITVLL